MKRVKLNSVIAALTWLAVSLAGCKDKPMPMAPPDTEPPLVRIASPFAGAVISRENEAIFIEATDNVAIKKVELFVSGRLSATDISSPWQLAWNTIRDPDGNYVLAAKAHDAAGHVTTDSITVKLGSLVAITEIELINVDDGGLFNHLLEIEAHLYESATNRFLGCSGAQSGLRGVEQDSVLYPVEAFFQKPPFGSGLLTFEEIKDKTVYLEIIEDDQEACPMAANSSPDDFVGGSTTFAGQNLATPQIMKFGKVTHLVITKARRKR